MSTLTTGDPNDLLTNTAPSAKLVRDPTGDYVSGTTLRCDHLADGTALGLLVEGQRTRDTTHPCNFGNAAWSKTDITVTDNATAAPDATTTADLITEGTAGTAAIQQGTTKTTASQAVSGSIFVKPSANNTWLQVVLGSSGLADGVNAWVNLSTGALGTVSARGSATLTGASIEAAANGFFRVYLWATFSAGAADHTMFVRSASADASTTKVNNSAYYLWHAQVELGARPSSPISPATNTAVTRAADDISLATSLLNFNASEGIFVFEGITPSSNEVGKVAVQFDDGTTSNSIWLEHDTSGNLRAGVTTGGVNQCYINLGAVAVNTSFKAAFSWAANDFRASLNGGTAGTDASGSIPTGLTTVRFGRAVGSSNHWDSWAKRWKHLPRKATGSAEIQSLAA